MAIKSVSALLELGQRKLSLLYHAKKKSRRWVWKQTHHFTSFFIFYRSKMFSLNAGQCETFSDECEDIEYKEFSPRKKKKWKTTALVVMLTLLIILCAVFIVLFVIEKKRNRELPPRYAQEPLQPKICYSRKCLFASIGKLMDFRQSIAFKWTSRIRRQILDSNR